MKIASWNVNSLNVRQPHVERWCADAAPDVLALQETKLEDAKFPRTALGKLGYQCVFAGQKTYNGVAIMAREPLRDIVTDVPDLDDPSRRVLAATVNGFRIVNLYVVNGQSVGSEKYAHKLHWLARVADFLRGELEHYPNLVVLGDFNIAPEDRDVHDPEAWREQVLCSTPEREALQTILDLGFTDSFRAFTPESGHYSWWDYRQGAFRRDMGLRIDLILVSEALRPRLKHAAIDRTPRTWERPSDHVPVIIEIES
ncbi:MAG: exodeoxyribonuclease III [Rhodanobacteraceae bacterium]